MAVPTGRTRNVRTMALLAGIAIGMGGLAFASVPLYRLFCQATGFGGTTQRADHVGTLDQQRTVVVRFNADTASDLSWQFRPEVTEVTVHLGEERIVNYRATNLSKEPLIGMATYNVTPEKAGIYFNKLQCFCFTEQRLEPGETAEMPVSFFVDADMAKDSNAKDIPAITLSYTFFRAKDNAAGRNGNPAVAAVQKPTAEKPAIQN